MSPTRAPAMFAAVAVQLPVRGTYTYEVPARMRADVRVGAHVLVPFGSRGVSGVVVRVSDSADNPEQARPIDEVVSVGADIPAELVELCLWIADYYEAPPGEVLRAAQPVGSQVAAVQRVRLTERGREIASGAAGGARTRAELAVLGALVGRGGSAPQRELVGGRVRISDLDALIAAGLVEIERDRQTARVKPRTVRVARLAREITDDDRAGLARATKRLAALAALEAAGGEAAIEALREVEPRVATHLRSLADAGLVVIEKRAAPPEDLPAAWAPPGGRDASASADAPRDERDEGDASADAPRDDDDASASADAPRDERAHGAGLVAPAEPPALTPAQTEALAAIRAGIERRAFAPFLLHGVTGSGKTEVYLHAIADVIARGQSAIVLVPEISLTPQLAARFRARFGDRVAVLHSALTDRQRYDEWLRLRSGAARIALGARSAVFAPVDDLGIIAVDEEHDGSFKQDEGVRYHARDVALVRAQRAGAVCVMGSATPSLESYHAAEIGRYHRLDLPERATPRPLPEISLIDLRTYRPESETMLTAPLELAIRGALADGGQVILFLNRRGFSTFVVCIACGHAFRCVNCSVSLTYHRGLARLLCHYCGYRQRVPETCPVCATTGSIAKKGLGTERVADEVAARFAPARVARLDRDTASGARIGRILERVARREVDILVGTQMVTKGHDFPGVTLVGVLCADVGLSLPDFRAAERTFQLLTQVAGRAGRGDRPGQVLIQTYRTDTPAVAAAAVHDYHGFYRAECGYRRDLGYPPFGHLIALRVDGRDAGAVESVARNLAGLAERLRAQQAPELRVMGPSEAPLARLKGRTRWHLWLRAPDRRLLRRVVRQVVDPGGHVHGGVRISVDVDPVSAM